MSPPAGAGAHGKSSDLTIWVTPHQEEETGGTEDGICGVIICFLPFFLPLSVLLRRERRKENTHVLFPPSSYLERCSSSIPRSPFPPCCCCPSPAAASSLPTSPGPRRRGRRHRNLGRWKESAFKIDSRAFQCRDTTSRCGVYFHGQNKNCDVTSEFRDFEEHECARIKLKRPSNF